MSEERAGGASEAERGEHFGRVVLQSEDREIYSLDLYETRAHYAPALACRGYYLHPRRRVRWRPVPIRVELSIDDDAFNAVYEMFGGGTFSGEGGSWEPDAPYSGDFELGGSWGGRSPFFHAEVSAPLRLPDGRVWTGSLVSIAGRSPHGSTSYWSNTERSSP